MMLVLHEGWSRGRLRFPVRATSITGKRRKLSKCEHNMPSGGGERCWYREIHEACTAREQSGRPEHGKRENDQLAEPVHV